MAIDKSWPPVATLTALSHFLFRAEDGLDPSYVCFVRATTVWPAACQELTGQGRIILTKHGNLNLLGGRTRQRRGHNRLAQVARSSAAAHGFRLGPPHPSTGRESVNVSSLRGPVGCVLEVALIGLSNQLDAEAAVIASFVRSPVHVDPAP